jgi:signal transduction histidine kinase/ligand-binding sensor domain-containing protein
MRTLLSCLLLAICCASVPMPTVLAAETVLPAIDMHHTSWTAKDGVPGFILAIEQTRDGWLWLASPTGLVRFDGVRFERFSPGPDGLPSSNISTLTALPDGGLWIGYRLGTASLWKDNVLHNYGPEQGLPMTTVWNLTLDAEGRMWAGTARGLYFMEAGQQRWQAVPASWEPPENITSALLDQRGTLWMRTPAGAWYLPRGEKKFRRLARAIGRGPLVPAPDGTLWTSDFDVPDNRLILLDGAPSGAPPKWWSEGDPSGGDFMFDRQGAMWRAGKDGIEQVSGAAGAHVTRALTPAQGFSGSSINSLLQDREGNIWIGTDKGVDRFRPNKLHTLELPKFQGEARAMTLDGTGGLWLNGLYLPAPYTASLAASVVPHMSEQFVDVLYTDPGGTVWMADRGKLLRRSGGKWEPFPLPPEAEGNVIFAIAREPGGTLWVSVRIKGIFRYQDGRWHKGSPYADGPQSVPMVITADNAGRVWFGYAVNKITLIDNGKVRHFGAEQQLRLGAVLDIRSSGGQVWAGGERGLVRYDGTRFVPLRTTDDDALAGASGIVDTPNGDLWVHGALGIARIGAAELDQFYRNPQHRVRYERLDFQDGLAGTAAQLLPRPSMLGGADGKLWFSTSSSVHWIDPAHIERNGLAPPVAVTALRAEGQALAPQPGMALRAGTQNLQLDYTAFSLTMAERMQFSYRLDGVDSDWKTGGPQRSAYYTNLGPGDYRFRVKASNNDGVWNDSGAELAFRIEPTMVQTLWFRLLCAAAAAVLLWSLYRLRLRQMARQIHARLDERVVERERIARELHDTLLQAVQGMMLHIQAALLRVPRQEPVRVMVETALQRADDILEEGRDKVRDLRASGSAGQDLAGRLTAAAAALAAGMEGAGAAPVPVEVRASGGPRCLHPIACEEILAIAREALANALQHSGAQHITVELSYGARELRLVVRDDGAGVPADVLAAGGRGGHWGMQGMRERAAGIKAKLALHSAPGAGTEWQLTLAADLAYQQAPPRWSWRRPSGAPD